MNDKEASMQLRTARSVLRSLILSGVALLAPAIASAQAEKPQYGGTLNIGTVFVMLSPLSWDSADWAWVDQEMKKKMSF
jgi:peptide/nickel transport system substrate-binding protein